MSTSPAALHSLLETRRSYRKFQEDRPVPREVVDDMLRAARVASSAMNAQPLRYVVVQDPALVAQVFPLLKWAGQLPPELGYPKEGERPVLYVVTLVDTQVNTKFGQFDAGLGLSNMTLAAWAHGVGSCILASVDRERLRALLGIDERFFPQTVTAFGYPAVGAQVVDPVEGDLHYYLDNEGNYRVPKLPVEELAQIR